MPAEASSKHIKALIDHEKAMIELADFMIKNKQYSSEAKLTELQKIVKKRGKDLKHYERALKSKLKEEARDAKKKK